MAHNITKLILPVAGLGKRLMPLTRGSPKSLVRVCGKPLLEYILEEGLKSGIKEVVLIVNPGHRKQFDEYLAKEAGRFPFDFYIREQQMLGGTGHALLHCIDVLGDKPFIVRFCDDFVLSERPVTASLMDLFKTHNAPIVLLERVPRAIVSRFAVVSVEGGAIMAPASIGGKIFRLSRIIEKPKIEDAPSDLTIVGGYAMTPALIHNLKKAAETLPIVSLDALPLALALQMELIFGKRVYGWEFPGKRLDCGTLESLKKTEKTLSRPN